MSKEVDFEIIKEEAEGYSDDSLFNISSWGADLSFREIISMYDENEMVKPELQRKYVWDRVEASRFIESLLMGLPVPSIFLAQSGSQKLIVDGYQRIMTVYDYIKGVFSDDRKVFKLSNSEKINSRWRNKSFAELTTDEQRKIKSTTIHAIIFEQKEPKDDDTSLYQVFERINTSGRTLMPQEIRNCVYQGTLNKLLFNLNDFHEWRQLYGSVEPDNRMRDIELVLRFFVMKSELIQNNNNQQVVLSKTFNEYMGRYRNISSSEMIKYENDFKTVMCAIHQTLGINAFKNFLNGRYTNKFNPPLFDAITMAYYSQINNEKVDVLSSESNHKLLFECEDFVNACKQHTTSIANIKKRINLAKKILFG